MDVITTNNHITLRGLIETEAELTFLAQLTMTEVFTSFPPEKKPYKYILVTAHFGLHEGYVEARIGTYISFRFQKTEANETLRDLVAQKAQEAERY